MVVWQVAYHLQSWHNAFATAASNAVWAHLNDPQDPMTTEDIKNAVTIFLTPDGNPPSPPYFWRELEFADDQTTVTKRSV